MKTNYEELVIIKNTENIEQLYLYLFELKKELTALRNENEQLKSIVIEFKNK